MSIKAMTQVWEHSERKGSELLLLLAIADFANDSGEAWPSIETLARKIRMSERNTRYLVRSLEANGDIKVAPNAGPKGCNLFTLQTLPPANQRIKGGKSASLGGAITVAPEPSIEPSKEPSEREHAREEISNPIPQRGPLLSDNDERLQTPHCQAVAKACQKNLALASHRLKGQIIVCAVQLAEAGYSPLQIELVGERWPHQTAPHPSQIGDNIEALLNQREKQNGYKSVGEQRTEQFDRLDIVKQRLIEEIAAEDGAGGDGSYRSDAPGFLATNSGRVFTATNDRAMGATVHALPPAR